MFSFGRGNGGYGGYDDGFDTGCDEETLESRATFRVIPARKKGRKGLRGGQRSLSEAGSFSGAETPFEAAAGFPTDLPSRFTTTATTPVGARDDKKNDDTSNDPNYFNFDLTSTQKHLSLDHNTFPALGVGADRCSRRDIDESDAETIGTIDKAMSHINQALGSKENQPGDDGFDSLDWDPDLPPFTPSDSPEPVQMKPQPVTYTTVGSLVDPNVKPQFSAPRRIQREGAGRAPLMAMLQNARFDPYAHPRGTPPSLNRASSMAYAQHIARSPVSAQSGLTPPATYSPFAQSSPFTTFKEQPQLTEQEKEILRTIQGRKDVPVIPRNVMRSPSSPTPSSSTKLSAHAVPFDAKESNRRSTLDLFQELQRQPGLSELSGFRSGVEQFSMFRRGSPSPTFIPTATPKNLGSTREYSTAGGLSPIDRFLQNAPTASNIQAHSLSGANGSPITQSAVFPPTRPGQPQPLTAGPPGQRQNPIGTKNQGIHSFESNTWTSNKSNITYDPENTHRNSPWTNNYIPASTPNVYASGYTRLPPAYLVENVANATTPQYTNVLTSSKITDTLPPAAVAQYYPAGIPTNMVGAYTPLSDYKKKQIDRLNATLAEIEQGKKDAVNDRFYHGQRRFATMTTEDYITELEEMTHPVNPYGPIAPLKKNVGPGAIEKAKYSVEDMANMPVDKVMAPLLNAAFGTFLSYATAGLSSRKALSGWRTADPEQIDDTLEGNKSLFGEDWGAPPKLRGPSLHRAYL